MRPQRWAAAAGVLVIGVAWLVVRQDVPTGAGAVVDLLVLPAVLFAEVWVVAGRPTVAPSVFAVLFGLGAVFVGTAALVLERLLDQVGGRSAVHVIGPLIEAAALWAPLVVAASLSCRDRRWTISDLSLGGLCCGLGFLLVQTSLVTAAVHAAPDYQSPVLAGLLRVPASAGSPPVYFVGPALATALVGLALGVGLRWRIRILRFLPALVALSLVAFDHALFGWRLRHLVDSRAASTTGLTDLAQKVSLQGRLALVLVIGGLLAARLIDVGRGGSAGPDPSLGGPEDHVIGDIEGVEEYTDEDDEDDDDDEIAEFTDFTDPTEVDPTADELAHDGSTGLSEPDSDTPAPPVAVLRPAWASGLGVVVALMAGAGVTVLARNRELGLLDSRPLALAVSLCGLGHALWHLPGGLDRRPEPALRHLLGMAAVASSALGVLLSALPTPVAATPIHGGLFLETVLGWGAHVGNLGFVFGLGGLGAPWGTKGHRRFGDRWSTLVLRRLSWTGLTGVPRSKRRAVGRYERLSRTGRDARIRRRQGTPAGDRPRGSFWWLKVSGGRWSGLFRRAEGDATLSPASRHAERERAVAAAVAVAIEPVHRSPVAQIEFVGATVKEAIETAMRKGHVDIAHAALQLVDEGTPAKPGKPGSGRPARIRVAAAGKRGDRVLVPPARDSITRDTLFVVVVEVPAGLEEDPPPALTVTLRDAAAPRSQARSLTCARVESSSERVRYRSNPYSVDTGEDVTWAMTSAGSAVAPAAGIRVQDGGDLTAQHRGGQTSITVYDSWSRQALAVNRWLLDVADQHHRMVIAELEERLERAEGQDGEAGDIRGRIHRLEDRLRRLEEARRILAPSTSGRPGRTDESRAFGSTAALHLAMSFENAGEVMDDAATGEMAAATYSELLDRTVIGKLWSDGAYSGDDVALVLGWDRFTEAQPPA
ncbi:MAG TPA: hypothetical protein VMZ51_02520 [Acidimicrobiales bacterium]|nr:hypothetical protein [Acidimicrobiales bacterium]